MGGFGGGFLFFSAEYILANNIGLFSALPLGAIFSKLTVGNSKTIYTQKQEECTLVIDYLLYAGQAFCLRVSL